MSNSLKEVENGLFHLQQIKNILQATPATGTDQLRARLDQIGMVEGFITQTITALSEMRKGFADAIAENQEVNTGSPPN